MAKICFMILALLSLAFLHQTQSLDGNESCTTDKSFAGYNHLFFPNRDKFTDRPKCDAKKHFGLDMKRKGARGFCFTLDREWWAIQVIPLGFSPVFNTSKWHFWPRETRVANWATFSIKNVIRIALHVYSVLRCNYLCSYSTEQTYRTVLITSSRMVKICHKLK